MSLGTLREAPLVVTVENDRRSYEKLTEGTCQGRAIQLRVDAVVNVLGHDSYGAIVLARARLRQRRPGGQQRGHEYRRQQEGCSPHHPSSLVVRIAGNITPAFQSTRSYVNRNCTGWLVPSASLRLSSRQVPFQVLSVFHT